MNRVLFLPTSNLVTALVTRVMPVLRSYSQSQVDPMAASKLIVEVCLLEWLDGQGWLSHTNHYFNDLPDEKKKLWKTTPLDRLIQAMESIRLEFNSKEMIELLDEVSQYIEDYCNKLFNIPGYDGMNRHTFIDLWWTGRTIVLKLKEEVDS